MCDPVGAYNDVGCIWDVTNSYVWHQGPVVQSPISANPGLTLNKAYGVNPGLALIRLSTTGPRRSSLLKALHVHVSYWLFEMFELTFVLGQ